MKLILDNKNLTEEFFEDTRLLGIMAPIKDYQLCWHLNGLMGMDFRINNDIEIQLNKKKRSYFFAVYEFCEPTGSLFIMYIITASMENTCSPNSGILIFYG